MTIRTYEPRDLDAAIDLTIETFRPFYEDYVRPLLGPAVFPHQHGQWEQDYRDELPTLHRPALGRHLAVADIDGAVAGLVAWQYGERPRSGQVHLVAVAAPFRRRALGRQLCQHALDALARDEVEVVGIGTGDDAFHAPARALYESLGFTKIPTAGYLRAL